MLAPQILDPINSTALPGMHIPCTLLVEFITSLCSSTSEIPNSSLTPIPILPALTLCDCHSVCSLPLGNAQFVNTVFSCPDCLNQTCSTFEEKGVREAFLFQAMKAGAGAGTGAGMEARLGQGEEGGSQLG